MEFYDVLRYLSDISTTRPSEISVVITTIINCVVTDRNSKINNLGSLVTSALVLDSFAVPWLTGGDTLHEFLGLKFGPSADDYITLFERSAASISNIALAGKNALYYIRRYYQSKRQ